MYVPESITTDAGRFSHVGLCKQLTKAYVNIAMSLYNITGTMLEAGGKVELYKNGNTQINGTIEWQPRKIILCSPTKDGRGAVRCLSLLGLNDRLLLYPSSVQVYTYLQFA